MDRLTYRTIMGDYGGAKEYPDADAEIIALRNALGKYEDLGYSPEQIGEIIEYYLDA